MLEKGLQQRWSAMFGKERGRHLIGQIVEVCGDEVRHLAVFGVVSGMINDSQICCIVIIDAHR